MRNFHARGDVLTTRNTTGRRVLSGEGVMIDRVFGIAASNYEPNDPDMVLNVVGAYRLPKTASQAWTWGQRVYWDGTNRVVTGTATGNTLIGVAIEDVAGGAGDVEGLVRLNGSF